MTLGSNDNNNLPDFDSGSYNFELNQNFRQSKWEHPQRTHPLSILIHASKLIPLVIFIYIATITPNTSGTQTQQTNGDPFQSYFTLGYLVLVFLIWFLTWRFRTFWIKDNELNIQFRFVTKGVKHLPLDRIQSIDVIEPLLGRFLGMAALRIASGATSLSGKSVIAYLKKDDAIGLRSLLLERKQLLIYKQRKELTQNQTTPNPQVFGMPATDLAANGIPATGYPKVIPDSPFVIGSSYPDNSVGSIGPSGDIGPYGYSESYEYFGEEQFLNWHQISSTELAIPVLSPFLFLLFIIFPILGLVVIFATAKVAISSTAGVGVTMLFSVGSEIWRRFSRLSGYKVDISNTSLRITSGLLTVNHETIPFERIQAFRIEQPFFWKLLNKYRVQINIACTSNKTRTNRQNLMLLPVCNFGTAVTLIQICQPQFNLNIPFIKPPKLANLKGLFWAPAHMLGMTDNTITVKYGIFRTKVDMVHFSKIQSLRIKNGPINRLLKLNNLFIDIPRGPVTLRAKWRSDHDAKEVLQFIAKAISVY